MEKEVRIEVIDLGCLAGREDNPNRMEMGVFKKLVGHIRRTGNYEPLVVRGHKDKAGCFEIINGHHRAKALRELGYEKANCVVWDIDDDEARIALLTLNRLGGSDDVFKKSRLIKELGERFDDKELCGMLAEGSRSIERLKNLAGGGFSREMDKVYLNPMVFFVNDEQKEVIDSAIAEAIEPGVNGTQAQKRAWAIVKILREAKR